MGRTKRVAFYLSPLKAKEGKAWALSCLWDAKQLLREDLRLLSALVTLGGRRGGIIKTQRAQQSWANCYGKAS